MTTIADPEGRYICHWPVWLPLPDRSRRVVQFMPRIETPGPAEIFSNEATAVSVPVIEMEAGVGRLAGKMRLRTAHDLEHFLSWKAREEAWAAAYRERPPA